MRLLLPQEHSSTDVVSVIEDPTMQRNALAKHLEARWTRPPEFAKYDFAPLQKLIRYSHSHRGVVSIVFFLNALRQEDRMLAAEMADATMLAFKTRQPDEQALTDFRASYVKLLTYHGF